MRNSNPTQKETTEVFTKEFSLFPAEDKIVDHWENQIEIQENLKQLIISISENSNDKEIAIVSSFQYMLFVCSDEYKFQFLMQLKKALSNATRCVEIKQLSDIFWQITESFSKESVCVDEGDFWELENQIIEHWAKNEPIQEALSLLITNHLLSDYWQGVNIYQHYVVESLKYMLHSISDAEIALFIEKIKEALDANEEICYTTKAAILWEATSE
tara:strand:- start:7131 stop:7775 length:645 start_codon:yes stop_codon:yes gene_type:complete